MLKFFIPVSFIILSFYIVIKSDKSIFQPKESNSTFNNEITFSKPHQVLQMELKKTSGKLILTVKSKAFIQKVNLSFALTKNITIIDHNIPHEFSIDPNKPLHYELSIDEVKNPHLIVEASGIIPTRGEKRMFLGNAQFYHIQIPESITDT